MTQSGPGAEDHRIEANQASPEGDHAGITVALAGQKAAKLGNHVDGGSQLGRCLGWRLIVHDSMEESPLVFFEESGAGRLRRLTTRLH